MKEWAAALGCMARCDWVDCMVDAVRVLFTLKRRNADDLRCRTAGSKGGSEFGGFSRLVTRVRMVRAPAKSKQGHRGMRHAEKY